VPEAIVATCQTTATTPDRGGPHYGDYTGLNSLFEIIIQSFVHSQHCRLSGSLPQISHLKGMAAAWNVSAARNSAWQSAERLWQFRTIPLPVSSFMDVLDGLTTVIGMALLVPVPMTESNQRD
jgi:hypothetical protein